MLDREARSHKPCQYLLHRSRLSGRRLGVHDSMIVADDCGRSEIMQLEGRTIMSSWGAEVGACQEDRVKTV